MNFDNSSRRPSESQSSFPGQVRRRLLSWIQGAPSSAAENVQRGRLQLESLEKRQMMAGDVELFSTDGFFGSAGQSNVAAESSTSDRGTSDRAAEGEPGQDLVQFAKDLDAAGVTFYGAHWCPACTQQKQLFEDGGDDLPFVEVTLPDRTQDPQFSSLNISEYPTWIFPDGSRLTGVQSLQTLSTRSGVAIPTSGNEAPSFEAIGSQTVELGSPLHIPIDGYDAEGGPLTVTVSVANPQLVEATVLSGNRSLRLDMDGFGDMVFELFEQRAPRATERVIDLADSGFYDGIIFHRVVNGFVIQGGDPTGTGTGGSNLGDFDDQFHPDLQHNRTGVLSFAKSSDDTNDSQFFITEVETDFLDFNHSVFGQLVEGEDVREAISNMQVNNSTQNKPTTDIVINNATVFNDTENSVIMLKGLGGTGTTSVTVTITDSDGNSYDEVISVSVVEPPSDRRNAQPYLEDINVPATSPKSTPAQIQLESFDLEGDAVQYFISGGVTGGTATVNSATGLLEVAPTSGVTGTQTVSLTVGVAAASGAGSNSDLQSLVFTFSEDSNQTPSAPSSLDLRASSDTGSNSSDNLTNASSMTFDVTGVTTGATVQIINTADNTVVGVGTATGGSVAITTSNLAAIGDGTYSLAARQIVNGLTSANSTSLSVTLDRTAPTFTLPANANTGNVGAPYEANLVSPDEGSGVTYSLTVFPSGATIGSSNGIINWTPTAAQLGDNDFTVELRDLAGNTTTESYVVTVAEEALARIEVRLTDLNGNEIDSIDVGQEFLLQLIGVDARQLSERGGIYSAYADIEFDGTLAEVVPGTSIEYDSDFNFLPRGTLSSGLFNEIGSASSRFSPTNLQESVMATVRMRAIADGSLTFTTNPADVSANETLLFFNNDRLPTNSINYGSATLAVGDVTTNNPPVGVDDTFTVVSGSGQNTLDVLANEASTADPGETLTITGVGTASNGGTVTVASDGLSILYTPAANFIGTDTFQYTLSDGTSTDTVQVTVNIQSDDNAPVANNDAFPASGTILEDSNTATYDVLANDTTDSDNESFTITGVGSASNGGTVAIVNNGSAISYKPAANFNGTETVTYTIRDTGGGLSTATVTFTVTGVNDAPVAESVTVPTVQGVTNLPVMTRDDLPTNVDSGEVLQFVNLSTPSAGGTVTVSSDGASILYTPPSDTFTGTDTFTYQVQDPGGLSSSTATITVDIADYLARAFNISLDSFGSLASSFYDNALLTGTNARGETVSLALSDSSVVFADGTISVPNMLPGTYKLSIPAVPFFQGGEEAQEIEIQSDADDTDENISLNFGRLLPQYIRVNDWFGSAPARRVVAAIQPGSNALYMQTSDAASSDLSDLELELNSAGTSITVNATQSTTANGATTTASVSGTTDLSNGRALEVRGQVGDVRLVILNLDDSGLELEEASSSSAQSSTQAAGEPLAAAVTVADATVPATELGTSRAQSSSEPAGEPIEILSGDADKVVGSDSAASQIDAAMPDVSDDLTRISDAEDAVASGVTGQPLLLGEAVDEVLTGSSDAN
ncbi:peptidylprolyl isomerase [Rhodopirellula sp. JC740]|uniref:peptidylprolyl isomerase n=1 Tax=Rhodopirellula halodulae TaxID=2894198 RepID=A0ABS8ND85_9BACT|nr:peptidylprolyl isomerase [Rhodopirellula sp. JC740]MCC9641513.1 peptidylprolyl isomerase [Rhodopirellula sp. JC740]